MSLLHEIQAAVVQERSDLAPILLRLRLLAARIGSEPLAEWVRHESEGYPQNSKLPDYRIIPVSYTASFSGAFGAEIHNQPISSYLIEKFAGTHWVNHQARDSIAALDDLLASAEAGSQIGINAANLIHFLQGNVYKDYACNSVTGSIARSYLAAIRHAVCSRVLELTLELEKSIPSASEITIGPAALPSVPNSATATQIAQQIIYGNFTSIASNGNGNSILVNVVPHNKDSLIQYLAHAGMAQDDAESLARLAESEQPDSSAEPMGPGVRAWLNEKLKNVATGTWMVGLAVAKDVIKEALLKYYDIK